MSTSGPPGTIAHRNVALLVVRDRRAIDELAAAISLEDFVLARVSETELVIDPARMGELAARLSDRGLAPLMKKARGGAHWEEDDRAAPPEVRR